MKHIIIGGVAGGATAAARIRRTDEKAEIFLLEKGKYISYANCGRHITSAERSPNGRNCSCRHRLRLPNVSISTCGSRTK